MQKDRKRKEEEMNKEGEKRRRRRREKNQENQVGILLFLPLGKNEKVGKDLNLSVKKQINKIKQNTERRFKTMKEDKRSLENDA